MIITDTIESRGVFGGIVVIRKKVKVVLGKSLLLVRAKGSDCWGLPGGKIEDKDLSIFHALQRELEEELGICFPLDTLLENDICSFRSKNPRIKDVAFVVRIIVRDDNDPGLIKIFKEGLPPNSEIEEAILVPQEDLSSIKLIGDRMKRMVEFAING